MKRADWNIRANAPVVVWLLAEVVAAVLHRQLPHSGWLMFHLLLLGAAGNAILVWSAHFAVTLLRLSPAGLGHRRQALRLVLFNAAAVLVVVGMSVDLPALAVIGAVGVVVVAIDHGWALWRATRRALPTRFGFVVRYYLAAVGFVVVGVALGGWMATGAEDARLLVAHLLANLFGWIGLVVAGTVTTLLPTAMRTRLPEGTELAAARALVSMVAGLVLAIVGTLAGLSLLAAAGMVAYLVGWLILLRPMVAVFRTAPAAGFAPWSLIVGCCWFLVAGFAWPVATLVSDSWDSVADRVEKLAVPLAAGFLVQVLLGALSFLVPVVLGGGPSAVRRTHAILDRAAMVRLAIANLALIVCFLPVPSLVRVVSSLLVLVAYAWFLPLVAGAVVSRYRSRAGVDDPGRVDAGVDARRRQAARSAGGLGLGVAVVVLAVTAAIAADPVAIGRAPGVGAKSSVAATGQTTTVQVEAAHMKFLPNVIDVPTGNRLVIELVNGDDMVHDLVFANGANSGRLMPGERATVDVGVIDRQLDGWCSIVGHRQLGMTLTVNPTGSGESGHTMDHGAEYGTGGHSPDPAAIDFGAQPGPDFSAHPARLNPAPVRSVHRSTMTVQEVEREVAPGVTQRLWTFNGTAPGPVLRGRVGDVFDIKFVNDGTMGHSIDFHAGSLAPDRPMRTINPGESLRYRFTARLSGIWMYHCGTMPMSAHIANGLFGAVIIDPPDLAPVAAEYVLVQSELYLGPPGGVVDLGKLEAQQPDAVVFNGYVNQYDYRPLTAPVGRRIRIWVLDAGPDRPSSFHVIGGQFDTVFEEGRLALSPARDRPGGSQALGLAVAQGGYVELTLPEAGTYPFVSHVMWDAEHGAHGLIRAS